MASQTNKFSWKKTEQQQKNNIFYAVRAEMLQAGHV
jgi:hypothetical protein